ncbi:ABC transporter ATP-binding protein, partial [bacterium]|nr:ABC transporter ATP-binding protein [bacterium]
VYSNFVEAKSVNDFFKYEIKTKETIKLAKKKNLILEFRDVCFTYPETDVPVLKNVSFKITKGDILGVLGENGSGKSTLIKLLYKIYIPTSGEVLLNGVNILEIDDVEYFSLIKCLSQEQGIENSLTVKEIIHLGNTSRKFELRNIKKAAKLASANDLIEKFNNKYEEFISRNNLHLLNKYSETKYISLSPGQARRINLAKTFYSQKPIIILDEPTSNIDPTASNTIFSNFKKFQKREILVIVTHDVLRVNTVANKILILESGKIIEYGDKEELLKNGNSKYFSLINSIKKSLN